MKHNMRYLILPDVHGREFWVKPVEETLKDTDASSFWETIL